MKPYQFPTMMKIFSAKNRFYPSMEKALLSATGAKGGMSVILPTEKYRWRLAGSEETYARIIEDVDASNTTKGLNGTTFRIKVDIDYWREPDVITFADNDFAAEIVGMGVPDGVEGTIYTCRLMTDNPSKFLPNTMIQPGMEIVKSWTFLQSEYASKGGTQQYGGYFEMEGQLGYFGQELVVSDKAWREDGRMEFQFAKHEADGSVSMATKFLPK